METREPVAAITERVLRSIAAEWLSRHVAGYPARDMANVTGGAGAEKDAADKSPASELGPEWTEHVLSVPCCPPAQAVPASGTVFRRHGQDGLQTYAELGRYKKAPDAKRCQAASFSVFRDLAALHAASKVHGYTDTQAVLVAELQPEYGVIART